MNITSLSQTPPRSRPPRRLSRRTTVIAAGTVLLAGIAATVAVHAASSPGVVVRTTAKAAPAAAPLQNPIADRLRTLTSCDTAASTLGLQQLPLGLAQFGLPPPLFTGLCSYGTVTAVSGSSLTMRTLDGTVTVTWSGTTTYDRAGAAIAAGDVHQGDVIGVRPTMAPLHPAGQVHARAITVETGAFFGRVQSVHGNTVTIVNALGQIDTVTATGSTRYSSNGTPATLNDVVPGKEILAQGDRNDLTHLTAIGLIIG